MNNNKTKNIILAVLVVGLVGMTIAYAALTQQLLINNNQVTVSSKWRVRFGPTVETSVGTTVAGTTTGASYTANTPVLDNDRQTIKDLQATFTKPGDYVEVAFRVQNEGNIAAKGELIAINLGNLTCKNGANSSIPQASLDTFCNKLTKWVRHSDRVTDWSAADTLAAYSGSGDNYPHIDGILRIEYPSTLSNSDIEAINGGSVVVTLGYTTLHFVQDDNAVAQSSGNEQGGGNSGNNEPEPAANYVYKLWSDWDSSLSAVTNVYNTEYLFYLRKNTDTNKEEGCVELTGGPACIENHQFDCTFVNGECTDTSSYIYQMIQDFRSKGATCRYEDGSTENITCEQKVDNDEYRDVGCLIASDGRALCFDDNMGSCYVQASNSYCAD